MAQGKGEKLNTLAQLHGCQSVEAQLAFAGMTQESYEKIIPSADVQPGMMIENLKNEVSHNSKISGLCQVAS
jgi:hypothetical protein